MGLTGRSEWAGGVGIFRRRLVNRPPPVGGVGKVRLNKSFGPAYETYDDLQRHYLWVERR